MKFEKQSKWIISLGFLAIFLGLAGVYIDLDGERIIFYEMGDTSPFMESFLPADRVSSLMSTKNGDAYVELLDDPVYLSAHIPPGDYTDVAIRILYQNEGQSVIEFGPMVDAFSQAFDLHPLENLFLDELSWDSMTEEGVTLWQRVKTFTSIADFLESLPSVEHIATYHYDIGVPYIQEYALKSGVTEVPVSLRGYHKMVTYAEPGVLKLDFTVEDLNEVFGRDDVQIQVRNWKGDVLETFILEDLGQEEDSEKWISDPQTFQITIPEEGAYEMSLVTTSDVVWRDMTISSPYLSFVQTLFVADVEDSGQAFFTDAKELVVRTYMAEDAENLLLADQVYDIPHTQENVAIALSGADVEEGRITQGSMKLVGDGMFSFSQESFLNPYTKRLVPSFNVDEREVDYVIGEYKPCERIGEWCESTISVDLSSIVQSEGNIRFAFSVPQIKGSEASVKIHAIEFTYYKEPWTIKRVFSGIKHRVYDRIF